MSRRIRSIKPEIIEDEKTGLLSDTAFRLFISMITIADDHGNVRADVRWLQAQIWWAHSEPPNVLPALIELTTSGLISVYGVRGGTFAHLNGWSKHQRVDNAGKQHRVPTSNDLDALAISYDAPSQKVISPRLAVTFREIPLDRIGEERRGPSGKPDLEGSLAGVAVGEINRLAGTAFEPGSKTVLELVRALVKNKHSESDVLAVIQSKQDWISKPDMRQHFCPSTLLRPRNFQKYLDDLKGRGAQAPLSLARPDEPETMFVNGNEYVIG